MSKIKCRCCGKLCEEDAAVLIDVGLTSRPYNYKIPRTSSVNQRSSMAVCPACEAKIANEAAALVESFEAVLQGRSYSFPFRLPGVGDVVYEVIDGRYPIVDSVITKVENGMYEATAKSMPDAGDISFTPFEIGNNLFLTKKAAQQEKAARAKREHN